MQPCEIRRFLGPYLLSLLHERPGHGYELLGRLREFCDGNLEAPPVYRCLRELERDGLVRSR